MQHCLFIAVVRQHAKRVPPQVQISDSHARMGTGLISRMRDSSRANGMGTGTGGMGIRPSVAVAVRERECGVVEKVGYDGRGERGVPVEHIKLN